MGVGKSLGQVNDRHRWRKVGSKAGKKHLHGGYCAGRTTNRNQVSGWFVPTGLHQNRAYQGDCRMVDRILLTMHLFALNPGTGNNLDNQVLDCIKVTAWVRLFDPVCHGTITQGPHRNLIANTTKRTE